jgi:hypothetical protein
MPSFKTKTVDETQLIYSILRERNPDKQIEIQFNDNTKEYTLTLTKEAYEYDPEVPLDLKIRVVYGDSVTGDTPLLLKKNDMVYIETIQSIFNDEQKFEYPGFKMFDKSIRLEKQYSSTDYQVWSDIGWVDIKRVIRHKTNKKMYRVLTHTGCVDVTEDHSLIKEDKETIKPADLKVGDSLLHSFPKEFTETTQTIVKMEKNKNFKLGDLGDYPLTEKEAEVWGFFQGDGSCGSYNCSWALSNNDLEKLNYFKNILESIEPIKFEILDTLNSSGVYKLVPKENLKYMVDKYRSLFYYQDKYKIVPNCILNASKEIKLAYWKGYCEADDAKTHGNPIDNPSFYVKLDNPSLKLDNPSFYVKGKIGAQCMYYLMRSIGFDMSINFYNQDIYRLDYTSCKGKRETDVKKIIDKGISNDYVYDIETEIGRFGVGVGQLIAMNTDSIFLSIKFNRDDFEKNRKDAFALSMVCGNNLTNDIFKRPPIELEFEKVYQPFILLTKKRYIGKKFEDTRDPLKLKTVTTAGIALTRRDYCLMVKRCYKEIIDKVMEGEETSLQRSLDIFKETIRSIQNYKVDFDDLVVSAMLAKNYSCALCKEKTEWNSLRCLKCKENNVAKRLSRCGKCGTKFNCLHTFSLAHVNLAATLLRRNEEINVNDRIQYLYIESDGNSSKKADLAEDPKYAKENGLKFNRVCYLEQLAKPILGFYKIVLKDHEDLLDDIISYVNEKLVQFGGKKLRPSDFKLDE